MLIFEASDQHLVEHHLVEIQEFQLFIIIMFDQMLILSSFFQHLVEKHLVEQHLVEQHLVETYDSNF